MKGIREKRSMLFLVQLPPPVHGVGVINRMIWEDNDLWEGWDRDLLELRFSRKTNQLRRPKIYKVFRFLTIWMRLFGKCLIHRYQYAYVSIIPVSVGFYRDLCYVALIKAFRIKPVYHIHLSGIENESRKRLIRLLYEWAFSNSIIIHPSEKVSRREFDGLNLRNSKIYIQPNGINGPNGTKGQYMTETANGLRILHMSHLYKFKGLGLLLEVFYDLVNIGYDIHLDIVGDMAEPSVNTTIQKYLDNPVTRERIRWHGLLTGNSKQKILDEADIMAYTSLKDTFPLVILEAMKSGLPIISSDIGAISEILEDQKSGLLFDAGNRIQLKEKLELLISDHDLRRTYGEKAKARYAANYTGLHFQRGMQRIFENL
jgi:glycosyltransferase involved in cell wall biosynthesis